jgi:hypothetical protein
MALITAEDMYLYFLDGIRKEYTGVVRVPLFNRIINIQGQLPWVKSKVPASDVKQKASDDLSPIFVAPETTTPLTPNVISLSNLAHKYLRLQSIEVKVAYGLNNECGLTGVGDWQPAFVMRADSRAVWSKSSYRKPKDSKVYYSIREGNLVFYLTDGSTISIARIEYIRYPQDIFYDPVSPVHSEFGEEQNQEICDMAIKAYLEGVRDPRYQTYLNELAMKAGGNL